MMVYEIISIIIAILLVFSWACWATHIANKNSDIEACRDAIRSLKRQLSTANARLEQAIDVERMREEVPLRAKCRCKHDAYQHDSRGCQNWFPIIGQCGCLATQNQVLYSPDPIRKMLPL